MKLPIYWPNLDQYKSLGVFFAQPYNGITLSSLRAVHNFEDAIKRKGGISQDFLVADLLSTGGGESAEKMWDTISAQVAQGPGHDASKLPFRQVPAAKGYQGLANGSGSDEG
jgi:hypothetical protein